MSEVSIVTKVAAERITPKVGEKREEKKITPSSPIGIFDSGVGGLTVLKEVMRQLPHEDVVYLADNARVPYGGRPPEEIIKFNEEIITFLINYGVKLIIMACGTSSSIAYPVLKDRYPIHIISLVEPGAKAAANYAADHMDFRLRFLEDRSQRALIEEDRLRHRPDVGATHSIGLSDAHLGFNRAVFLGGGAVVAFDHIIGFFDRLIEVTFYDLAVGFIAKVNEIARWRYLWRVWLHCLEGVEDGLAFFQVDFDQRDGFARSVYIDRRNCHHLLPQIANLLVCQHGIVAGKTIAIIGHMLVGYYGNHAGQFLGFAGINVEDLS